MAMSGSGAGAANSAASRDLQRVTLAYTLRQRLYQTAATKCTDWLARRNEPQLLYWKHCALGLTGEPIWLLAYSGCSGHGATFIMAS